MTSNRETIRLQTLHLGRTERRLIAKVRFVRYRVYPFITVDNTLRAVNISTKSILFLPLGLICQND
jgi:hypothetical protein